MLWLEVFANLLLQVYSGFEEGIDNQSETEVLTQFVEQLDETLAATYEENPLSDKKWLWELASSFKQANENNG